MSVSASVKVVVGFQVHHSDFWTTKEWLDDFVSCPDGHKQEDTKHKRCPECGGGFAKQHHTEKVPTEHFAKWIAEANKDKEYKPEAREYVDPEFNPRYSVEDQTGSFGNFQWQRADASYSTMGNVPHNPIWVIGTELAGIWDIMSSGGEGHENAWDERQLLEQFSKVRALSHALGIDQPVKLYLSTNTG
jgi:hypothetical protein